MVPWAGYVRVSFVGGRHAGIHSLWLHRDDPTVLRMQP